jgi:hypothetical protein
MAKQIFHFILDLLGINSAVKGIISEYDAKQIPIRHERDCYLIANEWGSTGWNGMINEIFGMQLFLKI